MTAEICIMNRRAAVLAADSATTVSRWTTKGKETRYFKGANKIFELSAMHPVGIMIYASAELMSVPWETIIKIFRTELAKKPHNSIDDYAKEFFGFLCTNHILFPESVRREHFVSSVKSAIFSLYFKILKTTGYDNSDTPDKGANGKLVEKAVAEMAARLKQVPMPDCIAADALTETKKKWRSLIVAEIDDIFSNDAFEFSTSKDDIADLLIDEFIKNPQSNGATGLVFCGFGDHEIFPNFVEYRLFAVVGDCALFREESKVTVNHETPAGIKAFAQTSMPDTFTMGISSDVFTSVMEAVNDGLGRLVEDTLDTLGNPLKPEDLEAQITKAQEAISDAVLESARKEHAYPLWQVIASLPIEEMAELAETLIRLQSLKEKVTSPTETVGGPVDVAVITKSEGLVWIKRKHYFPSELNSRYQMRQKSLYE